ncbi:MAG: Uma2 family endonuclease [Saprospiraceae bacterium]|nr:Uma2 family endonuclease [Saprospiraceae bacterium]MDZ4706382.1 Uma2 family endonuclease [Saprospiraceae bacterium]
MQAALAEEAGRRRAFREWVDDGVKAEFINGETIYYSPAKQKHLEISRLLGGLLHTYTLIKGLGAVWSEKAMISLTRNDYEPDLVFFKKSKSDKFTKDQLFFQLLI